VLLNPLFALYRLHEISPAFSTTQWSALTHPGTASYHPAWGPLLLFELSGQLALLVLALVTAWMFFRRRTNAPFLFVGFLVGALLFRLADLGLVHLAGVPDISVDASDLSDLGRAAVQLAIWGGYFALSRRVRLTFVRRRGDRGRDSAGPPLATAAATA
jgi:hypothetical protein